MTGPGAGKEADHFDKISLECQGLRPEDIPSACDLDLPLTTPEQVAKVLRDMRKPKSKVSGNIFPSLVNRALAFQARPLSDIYNKVTTSGKWPMHWKIDYFVPISKKPHPESLDDMRNISCTQFLSETYESS